MRRKKSARPEKGFTLVEVMIAAVILAIALSGMLLTYINMLTMTDLSRDLARSNGLLMSKIEEVKATPFNRLNTCATPATGCPDCSLSNVSACTCTCSCSNQCFYNGSTFSSGTMVGVLEISNATIGATAFTDLKNVRAAVAFSSRNRVFGEDQNLNGVLDNGEDDAMYGGINGRLNSQVETATLVANYTD